MARSRRHAAEFPTLLLLVGLLLLGLAVVPVPGTHASKDAAPTSDFGTVTPPPAGASAPGLSTDTNTAAREAETMSHDGLNVKERQMRAGAQKFEFQTEVTRLMDIIINSLYSNKDVFLRELISNASDAMDKIRFLGLTDPSQLGEGDDATLDIRIRIDKEKKILTIRDKGVGMTRDDLKENLGTIAKSGTSAFLESMQKGGDMNLIGQFGMGFYSAFLVADYVEVISKSNNDTQHVWESGADGKFALSEDTEGAQIGRGTVINLHLKDEAAEYLEEYKLKELVKKYSEFINFPIYLYTSKQVDVEVPAEDADVEEVTEEEVEAATKEIKASKEGQESEEAAAGDEGDVKDSEEDAAAADADADAGKTKTVKETRWDWELINDIKAIWLRPTSDVSSEEYKAFYKAISKDFADPIAWAHFKAEGDVEFKAILFIPPKAPYDFLNTYYQRSAAVKLYVRRVFISDDVTELLPRYLGFIKGIVDSDTLPLNVSREMLQQHAALKTIKKKLVRKVLDMIRKLSEEKEEEPEAEAGDDGDKKPAKKMSKYDEFWSQFGVAIKMGIIEDAANRSRLAKLLRFHTSSSPDKFTSLDEYVSRMKEGQKSIYYLAGATKEEVATSPMLERLLKKGYEVIFFTEPIDEYTMQNLTEYDDRKFMNASKEDLKFSDRDDREKVYEKRLKDEYKDFTKWWKDLLPKDVDGVKVSNRLATTPCVVVTSKYGWSANMERIMKAQALSDENNRASYMKGKKTLEINPRHPVIKELKSKAADAPEDAAVQRLALLMFEGALVESGFVLEDAKGFGRRMTGLVRDSLGVDESMEVEDEPEEGSPDAEPSEPETAPGSEPESESESSAPPTPEGGEGGEEDGGDEGEGQGHDGEEL